jgi:hypothetical protein
LEGVMVDSLCWEAACSELDFLGEGDLERERGVSDCQKAKHVSIGLYHR